MVVGIFTDTYYPEINGVATSVAALRRELEKLGHKAYVVSGYNPALREIDDTPSTYRLPSAPFLFLPSRRFAALYSKSVAHAINRLGLDIVHTNTEFSLGVFGKLIAAMLDVPVVHTFHTLYEDYVHYVTKGLFPKTSRRLAVKMSRGYCNSCQSIITPTDKTRDILLSYGVNRPISVVPTGIDLEKFASSPGEEADILRLRDELDIPKQDKVVLYVGRLAKEKRVDVLAGRMPEWLARRPDTTLLFVGDGPCREEIIATARANGVEKKLTFAGERPWDEIHRFYKLADVFVSASQSETQGLTFIEAMAAGLPALAASDRSIDNVVVDGVTGRLFDDSEEIADKLCQMLNDKENYEKMVENAKAIAASYSAAAFAKNIVKVYEEARAAFEAGKADAGMGEGARSGESAVADGLAAPIAFGKKTLKRIIM